MRNLITLFALLCIRSSHSELLGFSSQRLRNREQGFKIKSSTSCEGIEELYYADAVVDNFSPIENQTKWVAPGQRYWINKDLWGGPGFPIFVFIGGEGQESCTRLTNKMYVYNLAEEHKGLLVDIEHRCLRI